MSVKRWFILHIIWLIYWCLNPNILIKIFKLQLAEFHSSVNCQTRRVAVCCFAYKLSSLKLRPILCLWTAGVIICVYQSLLRLVWTIVVIAQLETVKRSFRVIISDRVVEFFLCMADWFHEISEYHTRWIAKDMSSVLSILIVDTELILGIKTTIDFITMFRQCIETITDYPFC